jgi:hypothetical protein
MLPLHFTKIFGNKALAGSLATSSRCRGEGDGTVLTGFVNEPRRLSRALSVKLPSPSTPFITRWWWWWGRHALPSGATATACGCGGAGAVRALHRPVRGEMARWRTRRTCFPTCRSTAVWLHPRPSTATSIDCECSAAPAALIDWVWVLNAYYSTPQVYSTPGGAVGRGGDKSKEGGAAPRSVVASRMHTRT